jgi:hypothetical protein
VVFYHHNENWAYNLATKSNKLFVINMVVEAA